MTAEEVGGGVPFVQHFGSALNGNPPLPVLMLDGVYVPHPDSGQPTFVAVPPPPPPAMARCNGSSMRWASLVARVLLADALPCPRCGGRMQWVAALTDPASIRTYLTGVGRARHRGGPQRP